MFIAVGTPSRRGDGHADLTYVFAAAEEIAAALDRLHRGRHQIDRARSAPGARSPRSCARRRPDAQFDVASNPEFLREGSAIQDFMRPDRVVIGAESERARAVMRELYRPLYLIETPILFTALETAELIKYAANSFLATKITFINEIADLCEKVGADVQDVARGIGLDGRIGRKFLHAGPGFGGSCFPKDCLALVRTAQEAGAPLRIVETVVAGNDRRKERDGRARRRGLAAAASRARPSPCLGLTFKPNTDDMRDSAEPRHRAGAASRPAHRCAAFDPEGMDEAKKLLPGVTFCASAYEAMEGAHALVIITEWNEFRALDLARVKTLLKTPTVVDLRNIYKPADMAEAGFFYFSIGREPAAPSRAPARAALRG